MFTRIRLEPDGIQTIQCPKCDSPFFELLPLGIPGTGTSVCLRCRTPIATWAREPKPLSILDGLVVP